MAITIQIFYTLSKQAETNRKYRSLHYLQTQNAPNKKQEKNAQYLRQRRPRVSDVQSDVTKSKGLYMYTCVPVPICESCSAKIKNDNVFILFC